MARSAKSKVEADRSTIAYLTPEAQENHMIALAMDLAEQQLADGTASPSVVAHFLKLGTEKAKLEREILEKQKDLIVAKTEAMESTKRIEELYSNAIAAMKSYGTSDEQL
jgi:hypothetical protein